MSKALLSFAVGNAYQEMLEVALPSFQRFADRHGYDVVTPTVELDGRPASWMKVPVLRDALGTYDEVLWVDADAVIVNDNEDINVPWPGYYWQALVRHRTGDGEVPGAGFWLLRQPMLPVLEQMWSMTQYLSHPWWEQAALAELMGYDPLARPMVSMLPPTQLCERTFFLDNGWSVHPNDTTPFEVERVMQATPGTDRVTAMREWAERDKSREASSV